jgi:hypothetical protein
MQVPHPTFCLHSDVFRITTEIPKIVSTTDHTDTERLLTAAT